MTAADLLGITLKELKREIEDGAIVAVWTALGERMTREELVAMAMHTWEQSVIEAALGKDAPSVLPEAIRLVELRARIPRYQRDVLRALARREGTSVDAVLTRELEDVACAYRDELVGWCRSWRRRWRGRMGRGESTTGELIPQVLERIGMCVCSRFSACPASMGTVV